jgi:methyl-accepting chemotaxis protein
VRLRQLNIVSIVGLLAVCVGLVAVMGWGLQRLASASAEMHHYFEMRERVGGGLRTEIESYLRSGDAEQLVASLASLTAVEGELTQLPATIAEPLADQLQALRQRLDGEMRAAGKLSGNPQALLQQAESDLRAGLAELAGLALAAEVVEETRTAYLRLTGELGRAVAELALARERFAAQSDDNLADNVRFHHAEVERSVTALQTLPPLGVSEAREMNAFEALMWSDKPAADEQGDRSVRLREELGFVVGRYPGALAATQTQIAAAAQARESVRAAVAGALSTLAGAEAELGARQQQIRQQVQWTLLSLVLFVAGIGCLLYGVQRHLGSTLMRIAEHLRLLAEGQLGALLRLRSPIDEVNTLSGSTGRLQQVLAEVVAELQQRSLDIGAAGARVLESAQALEQRQHCQRDQSAQAASAVTEMTAASERVATAAAEVTTTTELAAALIAQNSAIIDEATHSVGALGDEMAATATALLRLRDDADQVQDFVTAIRSIADRTNLLALNAAIEAARAGEQGRGFAVVADEVRQLAGRSSEASAQISEALERISLSSGNLARAVARQQAAGETTVTAARSASAAQQQLVDHVGGIRGAVAQIAAQAQGQYEAATAVEEFVTSVVEAAEQAAAQAVDSVRLSQALQETGQQVAVLAGRFALE